MTWGEGDGLEGQDWTNDYSDNMLIYGGPKEGKTTIATAKIREMMDDDKTAICYVINTDKGFTKPAKFNGLDNENYRDRIKYFYVNTIKRAIEVMDAVKEEVQERANPNDIVLFDLLSWSWDEAQKEFVNEISGGEVVGFLTKAMNDKKKFGAFEGLQWGYIKKAEDMVSNSLSRNPICRVIALARTKDIKMSYKLGNKKQDIWYDIGVPDTRKDIAHEFATIVKIEKFSHEGEIYRRFMIVGSRDFDPDYQWHAYDTPDNFWEQFNAILGGKEVEPFNESLEPPTVESGLSDEDKKELVGCIKENFANKGFTKDEVIDMCGEQFEDVVDEIIHQGVDNGVIFVYGEGVYSFTDPTKAEPEPEQPKENLTENISLATIMVEIDKLDDGQGVNADSLLKNLTQYYDVKDVEAGLEALIDKGNIYETKDGKIKNTDSVVYQSKKKEESVEEPEVEEPEKEDDGW